MIFLFFFHPRSLFFPCHQVTDGIDTKSELVTDVTPIPSINSKDEIEECDQGIKCEYKKIKYQSLFNSWLQAEPKLELLSRNLSMRKECLLFFFGYNAQFWWRTIKNL